MWPRSPPGWVLGIIDRESEVQADILRTGASSKALLDQMQPSVALISSGGEHGHPHQETLDRLEDVGAEIWRTDQDGDVLVVLDGEEIEVSAR